MSTTFRSLHRDCPICQGARRDCRENLSTGIIHCRDASANPGGQWRYIKDDAHGFGMWAWGEGKDARNERPIYVPKPSNVPSVASWSVAERDRAYRAMGGQLAVAHRVSIAKRPNVTPALIDALVARGWLWTWQGGQSVAGAHGGLPGVRGDGRLTYRQTWAIGIPDVYGEIAGCQLKNPDGGYLWASAPNHGGATPHIDGQSYPRVGMSSDDGGELPLGLYGDQQKFVVSAPSDGVANIAEGYFKPALAHCLYGGLWVGMAGGRWDNAENQLRHAVRVLDVSTIILNPDGGAIHNPSVMRAYRAFAKMLSDWLPVNLKVRWWGQSTKDDGDVDEISAATFHNAKLLSWAEFERLSPHRELSDAEKRRDANRRAWLGAIAEIAGSKAPLSRDVIAHDFAKMHTLSGPAKVGNFEELEYPSSRKLTILDGQKMTRKTSVALRSVVTRCESIGLSGIVYAPTRVLSRSLAQVLGAYTIDQFLAMPTQYRPLNPWIVACPESAWKLADLEFNVVIFDEPNESLPRTQSGILGNRPKQSRDVIKSHLSGCHWAIIAQDGVYRPTVAAVQRWGEFTPDQCETVRRERKETSMRIVLYDGIHTETESWDGIKATSQDSDIAFYSWFDKLVSELKAGQRIIIPCGAEGKGRAIHRVLRVLFPDKKGQTIDGKYTPQNVRSAFADNPSGFAKARELDWLIYSPTFDSGVSIEGTYFDAQFEYVRAFEPATNASQRGERYRDAIKGDKLTQRNVYIAQRGLPSMPPVDVFGADYWRALLTNPTDTEVINLAQQIGGESLAQQLEVDSPDDWLELPEFLAIQARETYFKRELLTQEWQRNGWDIVPGDTCPDETVKELSERFYEVNQGIIETKARAWAKATPRPLEDGVDVAGPIEATKAHKWAIAQQTGTDFDLLNNPEFAESWIIAGDNSLQATQVLALLRIANTNPELWRAISNTFALASIAATTGDTVPTLPCSRRVFEIAKLLSNAPGLWAMASGATQEWTGKAPSILAIADWARMHAQPLARLSAHSQRIHGLQFTAKTPAIKCVHRLLQIVGCDATCMDRAGSGARERRYRLVSLPDIEAKLAKLAQKGKRTDDVRRRLYRESTKSLVDSALAKVMETRAHSPEWAALRESLLARYATPSTTSVVNNPSTEVVDATPNPTHRWTYMALDGWLDGIEDGVRAIFRTVAGNVYTLSPDAIQAIV